MRCIGLRIKRNLIIVIVVACVLSVVSYVWVDIPLATIIHDLASPHLSTTGSYLEELGKSQWVLGYCLLVIVLLWKTRRSAAYRHLTLFSAVALSGLAAIAIKSLVNRARPPLLFSEGAFGFRPFAFDFEFLWQSFPSGHSTTGLAIAVAGSLLWPRLRWLMWPIGISIALARVAYNVHYLSDVMVGSALGIASALLVHEWSRSHFQPWADKRWTY